MRSLLRVLIYLGILYGLVSLFTRTLQESRQEEIDRLVSRRTSEKRVAALRFRANYRKQTIYSDFIEKFLDSLESEFLARGKPGAMAQLQWLDRFFNGDGAAPRFFFWFIDRDGEWVHPEGKAIADKRLMGELLKFYLTADGEAPFLQRKGSFEFLLGRETKLFNVMNRPNAVHAIRYKETEMHALYWSRAVDRGIEKNMIRTDSNLTREAMAGLLMTLIDWRAIDLELTGKMFCYNNNIERSAERFYYFRPGNKDSEDLILPDPETETAARLKKFKWEAGNNDFTVFEKGRLLLISPLNFKVRDWNVAGGVTREAVYDPLGKNRSPRDFLVIDIDLTEPLGEIEQRFAAHIEGMRVIGVVLLVLLLYLDFAPYISIRLKWAIFVLVFIGVPLWFFMLQQFKNLDSIRQSRYQEKKGEMVLGLQKIAGEIENQKQTVLGVCRALRDDTPFDKLSPDQKEEVSFNLKRLRTFAQVMVYDLEGQPRFSFSRERQNVTESQSVIAAFLKQLVGYFNQKAVSDAGGGLGELANQLITTFVGSGLQQIIFGMDEVSQMTFSNFTSLVYCDLIKDGEGNGKYLLFMICEEGFFTQAYLTQKTLNNHEHQEEPRLYCLGRLRNEFYPPQSTRELPLAHYGALQKKSADKFSGHFPDEFDPDYLFAGHFLDKGALFLVSSFPKKAIDALIDGEKRDILFNLLAVFALFILGVIWQTIRFLRPLGEIKNALIAVENNDFNHKLNIPPRDEIGELAMTFNKMTAGLAERARLSQQKAALSRFLSPAVVEEIARDPERLQLGGTQRFMTAFFTDIANFSVFSERLSPPNLVMLLNEYLTAMTDVLLENGGTLDKYEGDAIIAFFGAPIHNPRHGGDAIRTALAMQSVLAGLRQKWGEEGEKWPDLVKGMRMRIGINSGDIVTGNMGSSRQMNYTMMGDAVNLAARLESAAKFYGVAILVSETTLEPHRDEFVVREVDLIRVVGRKAATRVFEVLDSIDQRAPHLPLLESYNAGHACFRQRDFAGAKAHFSRSERFERDPAINPSTILRLRCEAILMDPSLEPPGQVWVLSEK